MKFEMSYNVYFVLKVLDSFPKLKSMTERVAKIPNIEKWLQERPKSDF